MSSPNCEADHYTFIRTLLDYKLNLQWESKLQQDLHTESLFRALKYVFDTEYFDLQLPLFSTQWFGVKYERNWPTLQMI